MNFKVMGINLINFLAAGSYVSLCESIDCWQMLIIQNFLFNVSKSLSAVFTVCLQFQPSYVVNVHFIPGGHWLGGVTCICLN